MRRVMRDDMGVPGGPLIRIAMRCRRDMEPIGAVLGADMTLARIGLRR